ncbi:hypothetical protein [Streptomyces sp. NPDC026092]|uniref:hypothetical protein n=1 Tax=unclassified Streptomyces TaxID=2593676 RepID=UPI0033CCDA30
MMKKLIRAVAGVAFIAAATVGALGAVQDPGWHSEPAGTQVAAVADPGWSSAPAGVNDPGWSLVGA